MNTAKDYYQILGVPRNAGGDQIKKTYRRLAMQYHPDRNPGREQWANDKFKEINEAFAVLGNPEKRRQYDQFGTVGNISDIFGSSATSATFEEVLRDFGGSGLGLDFLDNIFSDLFQGRGFSFKTYGRGPGDTRGARFQSGGTINWEQIFGRKRQPPPRGVCYEITVTREQTVWGVEKYLKRRGKTLRVKIPAGVKTGTYVKLRNARQITDGQPGDITIVVTVK